MSPIFFEAIFHRFVYHVMIVINDTKRGRNGSTSEGSDGGDIDTGGI